VSHESRTSCNKLLKECGLQSFLLFDSVRFTADAIPECRQNYDVLVILATAKSFEHPQIAARVTTEARINAGYTRPFDFRFLSYLEKDIIRSEAGGRSRNIATTSISWRGNNRRKVAALWDGLKQGILSVEEAVASVPIETKPKYRRSVS